MMRGEPVRNVRLEKETKSLNLQLRLLRYLATKPKGSGPKGLQVERLAAEGLKAERTPRL